jgi:hypothetical protein
MLTIKIKNNKALELFNIMQAEGALKFYYVNMNACYSIDNEAIWRSNCRPLTISNFMARFFNYLFCADDHSLKT